MPSHEVTPEIEKVARAICEAAGQTYSETSWIVRFGQPDIGVVEYYRKLAIAALKALIEPSEGMIAAGFRELRSSTSLPPIRPWQAMIRAALGRDTP